MVNIGKSATSMTAIAYCSTGTAPQEIAKSITVHGHQGATARATCPAGTSLLFGGVEVSPPTGSTTHFSAVTPFSWTAASRTQWAVTGYNIGDQSGTLIAFAYCR